MINPDINPNEVAKEELEKAIAEGARFAFEMESVVLSDLDKRKKDDKDI